MPAISGHKAAIKVTSGTVTTTTNGAAVLSTDGVTLQLTDETKRHWDIDSATQPSVFAPASTSSAVSSATYSVNHVQGIVSFTTPHTTVGTYVIDTHSVTASSWANANQWAMTVTQPILNGTRFGSTWMEGIPGLRNGAVTVGGFSPVGGGSPNPLAWDYMDAEQRIIVELFPASASNDRYEAYGWIATDQVTAGVDALIGETVDITIDGPVYYTCSTA